MGFPKDDQININISFYVLSGIFMDSFDVLLRFVIELNVDWIPNPFDNLLVKEL